MKLDQLSIVAVLFLLVCLSTTQAKQDIKPKDTDPKVMGWMHGFPPQNDRTIRNDSTGFDFPQRRWSFSHMRELKPTVNVWRGKGLPSILPESKQELSKVKVTLADGKPLNWEGILNETFVDGVIVLHKGKVIEERYFGELNVNQPHLAMSMTKSFTGTLAAMLVEQGIINENKLVVDYLPELAGSGYADATVRQVMDMLVDVVYSEDYTDPNADVYALTYAGGVLIPPPEYTGPDNIYDYLRSIKKQNEHGKVFAYRSSGTQILSWIMNRATGKSDDQLLSEMIWQKLGAEHDAYYTVDSIGTTFSAGGLNTTLRDLARFGEMIRQEGFYNGQQIIPKAVVKDIAKGGDRKKYAVNDRDKSGGSYRNQWWISHDRYGSFSARGFNNQRLYINASEEIVIAWFSSHWSPDNREFMPLSNAGIEAIVAHLISPDSN